MQRVTGCHGCEPQTTCSPIDNTSTMAAAAAATGHPGCQRSPLPEPQTTATRTTTTTMGGTLPMQTQATTAETTERTAITTVTTTSELDDCDYDCDYSIGQPHQQPP